MAITNPEQILQIKRKSLTLFSQNYNCAQAVTAAFAEFCPFDEDLALQISCGFGGGFGGLHLLCGAVSGMAILVGALECDPKKPEAKKPVMQKVKALVVDFEGRNDGLIQCSELLRRPSLQSEVKNDSFISSEFPGIRPCAKYVLDCVDLLCENLDITP